MVRLVWLRLVMVMLVMSACAPAWSQCQQWVQQPGTLDRGRYDNIGLVYDRARQVPVALLNKLLDDNRPSLELYGLIDGDWVRLEVAPGTDSPGGQRTRFGHCYHAGRQTVMVYGGFHVTDFGVGEVYDDFWEWDGTQWHQLSQTSPRPLGGTHVMVYDSAHDRLIVLAEEPGMNYFYRTWEWDGTGWAEGSMVGPLYTEIGNFARPLNFVFDESRGRGLLVGQNPIEGGQDVWEYTPAEAPGAGQWQKLTATGFMIPAGTLVYDEFRRRVVRVGGSTDRFVYELPLQAWDPVGHAWYSIGRDLPFDARRDYPSLCFDPQTAGIVMAYGNFEVPPFNTTYCQDSWVLYDDSPGLLVDLEPSRDYCAGETAVLSVTPTGGADVEWYKDGQLIAGANGSVLVLPDVDPSDSGLYVARAYNACGLFDSSPCDVAVRNPASITVPPIPDNGVCPGDDFVIVGPGYAGSLPIDVQLQRLVSGAWVDVPGQLNAVGNIFVLANAQHTDTGDYRFSVSNACATVFTDPFRVQVGVSIDAQPINAAPAPCDDATFSVQARGVLTLGYQWFVVRGINAPTPLVDDEHVSGVDTPNLTIHGVVYEDEAYYFCRVSDACETVDSSYVSLRIPGSPPWVQRTVSGPSRRHYATDMVYDPSRGVTILYGGFGPVSDFVTDYLDDTWEWDGYEWVERFPAHNPGRRTGHRMAYDPTRQAVLLFGGYSTTSGYNSEVWAYDGDDWTQLTTSGVGPPALPAYAGDIAVHEQRGKLVVPYDTSGSSLPSNNVLTWELDLSTLAWQSYGPGPGPSIFASPLIYNASREKIVSEFAQFNTGALRQTWSYWGFSWAPIVAAATPPNYNPVGAFDQTREQAVIYGCCRDIGQPINVTDTWALDRDIETWRQILGNIHTDPAEAVRAMLMTYDTRRRAMVMAGSSYNGSFGYVPLETWEYRYLDHVVFDRGPVDVGVEPGEQVLLDVRAAGYGTLTYQWRRNGQPLVNGPTPGGSILAGVDMPMLTIDNAQPGDAGSYDCLVTNNCGGATSGVAHVAVGAPCPADLNADGRVDFFDVQIFLNAFAAHNAIADWNDDSRFDFFDVQGFLNDYAAGCP